MKWFRWGDDLLDGGYAQVPNLLLRHQKDLRLTPPEINLIVQAAACFRQDNSMSPSGHRLASQMGLSDRQVIRIKRRLIRAGYLICTERHDGGRRITDEWDFSGLTAHLRTLVSERGDTDVTTPPDKDVTTGDDTEVTTSHTDIHTDPHTTTTTSGSALVAALAGLPYWTSDPESDALWLAEFSIEWPDFCLQDIRECRDFNDGKRARHKGDWKNRLRNWKRVGAQRKEKHGTTRQGTPTAQREPTQEAVAESWERERNRTRRARSGS